MLDIEGMIQKNDFSPLLNSTQEERELSGGNKLLFNQLKEYLCFDYVQQIMKYTFAEDKDMVEDINQYILLNIDKPEPSLRDRLPRNSIILP